MKTNAPNHVVWDVVRAWCKRHWEEKGVFESRAQAFCPASDGYFAMCEGDRWRGRPTGKPPAVWIVGAGLLPDGYFAMCEGQVARDVPRGTSIEDIVRRIVGAGHTVGDLRRRHLARDDWPGTFFGGPPATAL